MRFDGSYRAWPKLRGGQSGPRGVLRFMKMQRRAEADLRNAKTPHNRTKQHRIRCALVGYVNCNN